MFTYELNTLRNKKGSTLVGVVAIAIILTIGALAYAAMVRNVGTNEHQAYYDAKAYYVAEQGARLVDNWLSIGSVWDGVTIGDDFGPVPGLNLSALKIYHDIDCDVKVKKTGANGIWLAEIVSTASSPHLPYDKVVTLKVPGQTNQSFALYVGNGANFGDENYAGLQHWGLFVGPVHFNSPIQLSKQRSIDLVKCPEVNGVATCPDDDDAIATGFRFQGGDVSVYNPGPTTDMSDMKGGAARWWTDFGISSKGNDYSKGVAVNKDGYSDDQKSTAADLDRVFRAGFNPYADKRTLEFNPNPDNVTVINFPELTNVQAGNGTATGLAPAETQVEITFSVSGSGTNSKSYYKIGNMTQQEITGKTIINAISPSGTPYSVKVVGNNSGGQLDGKVTVVTPTVKDAGGEITCCDIEFDFGSTTKNYLTYKGVSNSTDYKADPDLYPATLTIDGVSALGSAVGRDGGVDLSSKNKDAIFAFYSGKDIKITTNVVDMTVGAPPVNYITGQLVALNGTINVDVVNSSNTDRYSYQTTRPTSGTWVQEYNISNCDNRSPCYRVTTKVDNTRDAKVQVIGSVSMGEWWDTETVKGRKQMPALRTYFDKRTYIDDGKTLPIMGPGLEFVTWENYEAGQKKNYVGRGGTGGGSYRWEVSSVPK